MVLFASSSIPNDSTHPPVVFWSRPWVQNLLPLATSLLLHIGIIVVGIGLFQAVKQVSKPKQDQVIIPQMGSIARMNLPSPIQHPMIDAITQPVQTGDPDLGMEQTPKTNFPVAIDASVENQPAGPAPDAPGNPFNQSTTGGVPWGVPGGSGSGIRFINVPGGNARSVVFLCDASGSMLGVFAQLKQQLRESISNLQIADGQSFNVIFFSDDNAFPLFKDGLKIATADNKKLAMDFIDSAVSTGGTQPLPAIKMAMNQHSELIYVLTDGFDQIANFEDVTKAFKEGNKDGRTHINCIFLQSDEDPKLEAVLRQIANDGHGVFRKILKSDM